MAGRPSVAVTAALRALPAADRRLLASRASPIGEPVPQGAAIEMAGRPAVAVTAALRALPATDRRLLVGPVWYTGNGTALHERPPAAGRLQFGE
jgi:2-keto-4-pentenoate hydratase